MYAGLLAKAMDAATASTAHPAFVQIIQQLTPDEARLLRLLKQDRAFPLINIRNNRKDDSGGKIVVAKLSTLGSEAGLSCPELVPAYLDNLERLGLLQVPEHFEYVDKQVYDHLISAPFCLEIRARIDELPDRKSHVELKGILISTLGRQFMEVCVD